MIDLLFAWGGHEGTHTIANVSSSLGGTSRPSLYESSGPEVRRRSASNSEGLVNLSPTLGQVSVDLLNNYSGNRARKPYGIHVAIV